MEQPQLELPDSQPIFPEIEYEETNFTNNIIHYDVEVVESEKEEKDPNPPRVRPVARPLAAEFDASGNPGGCEVQDVGDEDDVEIVSATEGAPKEIHKGNCKNNFHSRDGKGKAQLGGLFFLLVVLPARCSLADSSLDFVRMMKMQKMRRREERKGRQKQRLHPKERGGRRVRERVKLRLMGSKKKERRRKKNGKRKRKQNHAFLLPRLS